MKISYNWLKDYIEIPCDPQELGEILTNLGLEVEGMEKVESVPGGLHGIKVGFVEECFKHPNADRLTITKVNIGDDSLLQIICGAPNVEKGQKVLVAPAGTTIHPIDGEPVLIRKGKIRGEYSEGMICAEDELGLGEDHSGIVVLPMAAETGSMAADYYDIQVDYVFDIGLTPNRSDATSHLGVARDLAAYFTYHHEREWPVRVPDNGNFKEKTGQNPISVEVRDTDGCPRYSGVSIGNLHIKPSPEWMQFRLKAIGVRPINNIVDITNYVLHEYGQPLHAFDAAHIANNSVIVQKLNPGTLFKSLDEVDRHLQSEDLMICDGQSHGMCIAGVFGGINSGVTAETKAIFLESAHFNPRRIRQTSMFHNLRTDAAVCFEKGTDPNITVDALKRAAVLMEELANAEVISEITDIYPEPIRPAKIAVRHSRINQLIGNDLTKDQILRLFTALNIHVKLIEEDTFYVEVGTDKTDVTREIDVIEEILRVYGFNSVKTEDRIKIAITPSDHLDKNKLRQLLADFLVGKGFLEMMGMSLVSSNWYAKSSWMSKENLVYISNTSNVHLDAMRPEMLYTSLQSTQYNLNRQQRDLALFEFGNAYTASREEYREKEYLCLVLSGKEEGESWLNDTEEVTFFSMKRIVEEILEKTGIPSSIARDTDDSRFSFGVTCFQDQDELVTYGSVARECLGAFDIKEDIYYAEFSVDAILNGMKRSEVGVKDIPRYPSIRRDLALIVDQEIQFSQISTIIAKTGKELVESINLFDVYQDDKQIGKGKKSYALSIVFVDETKSLKDKEVDKLMNKVVQMAEKKLGARLR